SHFHRNRAVHSRVESPGPPGPRDRPLVRAADDLRPLCSQRPPAHAGQMSAYGGEPADLPREPWFRQHPTAVLAVAGVLFASVWFVRLFDADAVDASTLLFTLPVALIAVAFGLRAGLLAGLLAVLMVVIWLIETGADMSPLGWISRCLPELLLGILLGDASQRLRRAEEERRRLESGALLYREAIEINDSLVQGMAAAR